MEVPLFDMRAELAVVREEVDAAIARVLDSGIFIGGPEVAAFERELEATLRVAHAIGTSSGTDALHAVFMALDIAPGDEVVTTPFTFIATASSAARLGARIVFADVDDATLTLDPARALAAVSDRTRAVTTVHLYGHPAEAPAVTCPVIEDAAQSIGAAPLRGLAATLSFFPTKNVGAIGDAGAIVSNDPGFADRLRLLRTHGARPKYHHLSLGGNFRLDAIQAAVLRAQLRRLAQGIAARRTIAARYRALFASTTMPPELRLPAHHSAHVYHQFVIRAPLRDGLRSYLAANGIGTEVYYPEPLHLQPCFASLGYRAGSMPVAERACAEVLALPVHPQLAPESQAYIVDAIAAFYR